MIMNKCAYLPVGRQVSSTNCVTAPPPVQPCGTASLSRMVMNKCAYLPVGRQVSRTNCVTAPPVQPCGTAPLSRMVMNKCAYLPVGRQVSRTNCVTAPPPRTTVWNRPSFAYDNEQMRLPASRPPGESYKLCDRPPPPVQPCGTAPVSRMIMNKCAYLPVGRQVSRTNCVTTTPPYNRVEPPQFRV